MGPSTTVKQSRLVSGQRELSKNWIASWYWVLPKRSAAEDCSVKRMPTVTTVLTTGGRPRIQRKTRFSRARPNSSENSRATATPTTIELGVLKARFEGLANGCQ